ncbi:MAG: hypothetical protein NTW29_14935 [Bacteroidetes bacterium]|nr:hypothetical protein [Bacteroidota bacterium]
MKQIIKNIGITICVCTIFIHCSNAQTQLQKQVDSIKYLQGDPFACTAVTWRIIANRMDAIQLLIDQLADSTMTNARDKCKKTNLAFGDIAFLTLKEILPLPFFAVTQVQCDVIEDGCQLGIFEYIAANRLRFRQQVQAYYNRNKNQLKWRQLDSNYLTPCHIQNNIKGIYFYD